MCACRVMLQQCAPGTLSANSGRAKQLLRISSQLIDKYGGKCLYGTVCLSLWCCIWVSHIVYVWTDIMHASVCTHWTPPPLSERVCLSKSMPQWKCVCIFVPKEKILCMVPYEWLRQTECVFIERLWVVLCVSFTLTEPFVPRGKSYDITAITPSPEVYACFLLKKKEHTNTSHGTDVSYLYLWKISMCLCVTVYYFIRVGKTTYSKYTTGKI